MECNSYSGLPPLLAAEQPEVVFSIRFAGTPRFPAAALIEQGGPRRIAGGGSGIDQLVRWDPARTTVTNAAGVAAHMMAEYVLGAALHFLLDVPGLEADRNLLRR
jgi:phosphoglycerate dehydrogenase-like enzyme